MSVSVIILIAVLSAVTPGGNDLGHKGPLNVACVDCHTRLPFTAGVPSLRNEVGDVCNTCHPRHHGSDTMRSHPVNASPAVTIPPDMILDSQGKIGCVTCHTFHGEYRDENGKKRFYLRRSPGKAFCYSCHAGLPGLPLKKITP
jgi:hypothetical protein